MQCISCQAQLAPNSTHCYFCGAAQPAPLVSGAATAGHSPLWLAQSASHERWRVWVSFFLGGLYAPLASGYLYRREEWTAGAAQSFTPPPAPSSRGVVVLGLFLGVPCLMLLVLGLFGVAQDLRYAGSGYRLTSGIRQLERLVVMNVPVAGFYLLSAVAARRTERRFALLLHELTSGDTNAVRAFRGRPLRRVLPMLLAATPLFALVLLVGTLWISPFGPAISSIASAYVIAVPIAAGATSAQHVSLLSRFRRVVQQASTP